MAINLIKDPGGMPAVDLTKVRDRHPDLAKRADKAGISLSKRGLAGIRAQACLYLDHSRSMFGDYRSGAVQTIVERALGFALQIDVDGTVPVTPFDSRLWPTVNVTVVDGEPLRVAARFPGGAGCPRRLDAVAATAARRKSAGDGVAERGHHPWPGWFVGG